MRYNEIYLIICRMICNEIAKKTTKAASKTTCEDPGKSIAKIKITLIQPIRIPKEKHLSPEKGEKDIFELRLL